MPITMKTLTRLCLVISCISLWGSQCVARQDLSSRETGNPANQIASLQRGLPQDKQIKQVRLGTIQNAFKVGNVVLAGQPQQHDLATLRRGGVKRVVNLYRNQSSGLNETAVCRELQLDYQHVPFDDESQLNDNIFNTVRIALLESNSKPVLIHCKSNDRVGAVWAAYRTLDQGIALETAILEAKAMGLKTAGYERKLRGYVARMLNPAPLSTPLALPGSS